MTSFTNKPEESAVEYLVSSIQRRTARIAVVGLGYVGLPMAIEFSRAGFSVVGIEIDLNRCTLLARRKSYIADVSDADLEAATSLSITSDMRALVQADAILICVPTPLRKSKDPDLTAILAAGSAVAQHIRRGQLVVLESTTYPGTTEEVLKPMLEESGLHCGDDFFLAFSPERVDPGNAVYSVRNITKLVGSCSPTGGMVAAELYRQIVGNVVLVSSPRVAEAAKLLENTFRSVNIAMANEMAIVCRHLGIDVWEVIDAAATKPFGFMPHYPGPGIGGHCIPLDPHYLSWKTRLSGYEPRFISLASEINAAMPRYVFDLISEALNDHQKCVRGSRIAIIGVAYKPNVSDYRESPALEIMSTLRRHGANLTYCDPFVPDLQIGESFMHSTELTPNVLIESDCVVIVTNHTDFDYKQIVELADITIDTRNATRAYDAVGDVRFI